MAIKLGYIQTEIGIFPNDWKIDNIDNLAQITTGAKNTQDKIEDGDYPFFVRSQTVEKINSYSFDGEAVLTAGDGVGTGKIFHYIKGKFDFHQRVYKISNFAETLNGYFFYLYFSNYFFDRIMSMTAKSSVDSVRMEMIANMLIPIPPLPEQQAIAEALLDVDALIAAQEALIAKKRAIKQGVMQELLTGKRRLPGFSGEWERKKLASICDLEVGRRPKGGVTEQGDVPSLGGENILNENGLNLKVLKKVSNDYFNGMKKGILKETDILINKDGANTGKVAIYVNSGIKRACINEHLFIIRGIIGIDNYFLYYLLCLDKTKIEISKHIASSAQPGLNRRFVESIILSIPTLTEQNAIGKILFDIDNEIALLEKKLDKTKAIKQGMMQELLTGRIRLTGVSHEQNRGA